MERVELTVELREDTRKGANKRLRRGGMIPGVVYHRGEASRTVQLDEKALLAALRTDAGRNALINLSIKGEKADEPCVVVVKDIQHDPIAGKALHVDFHQISLTEKISVAVPVVEKGEAKGVKNEGGVLELPVREVEVECLPTDIPEAIQIDVTELGMNDTIYVKDLTLSAGVTVLSDPETVLAKVVPPHVEKEAEAPTGEIAEPELIRKEKKEGEEEAPAAEKAPEAPKEGKKEGKDKK